MFQLNNRLGAGGQSPDSLNPPRPADCSSWTAQGAANASLNALVAKYGVTTSRTNGVVVDTNFTAVVSGTTFYYQYRIGPPFPGGQPFSQPGDSGAAVFDGNFNVIGLVMAGGRYTVVNPIGQIINALNISVP